MSSPVIGISTYGHITTSQWDFPAVGVPRPYVEAVGRAGGEPLLIPPGVTPPVIIERLDGIVLSGGGDIDPRRYGQQPHRSVERLDGQRDETEIALVRLALEWLPLSRYSTDFVSLSRPICRLWPSVGAIRYSTSHWAAHFTSIWTTWTT